MKRRHLFILFILVMSCLLTFSCINDDGFDPSAIDVSASLEKAAGDTEDSSDAQLGYTGTAILLKPFSPSLDCHLLTSCISFPTLPILVSASILRC